MEVPALCNNRVDESFAKELEFMWGSIQPPFQG